jgi:NADP-dependent 3-hydroxy acid dehydrogenase YdfG
MTTTRTVVVTGASAGVGARRLAHSAPAATAWP